MSRITTQKYLQTFYLRRNIATKKREEKIVTQQQDWSEKHIRILNGITLSIQNHKETKAL